MTTETVDGTVEVRYIEAKDATPHTGDLFRHIPDICGDLLSSLGILSCGIDSDRVRSYDPA